MDAFRIEFLNYLEAEPGTLQYDLEALETAPPPFSTLDDVVILRVGQTQMGVILTGDQQWVLVVSNELPAPYWAELTDELIAQFNIHMSALFHLPALPPTGEMDAGLIEGSVDPSDLPAEAVGVPPVDEAKPDTSPRVETAVEDESPEPNRGLLGRFFPSANGQTPDDVSPDEDEAGAEGETEQVPLADLQNLEEQPDQPPMSVRVARATNGHGE
jgi:hypothetical protein